MKKMKIILISLILSTLVNAQEITVCKKAYLEINKHSKRAGIFIKSNDWDMASFYIEKLKKDYTVFIENDCFDKVFEKMNVEKMKIKYRKNIRTIKDLSEMTNETLKEKRRIEKIKVIEQRENAKERERMKIRDEVRAEILKEYRDKD